MKSRDFPPPPSALSRALKRTFGFLQPRAREEASPPAPRHVEFESLEPRLLLSADVEVALRQILVDTLTLLAVVEVLKTTLAYCSDGRVRVTFIIDTVLVVMLTEVISRWFTSGDWQQFTILGGILLTLGAMRIVAVRYSPAPTTVKQQAHQLGLSFP